MHGFKDVGAGSAQGLTPPPVPSNPLGVMATKGEESVNEEKYIHLLGRITLLEALISGFTINLCKASPEPKTVLNMLEKGVREAMNFDSGVTGKTTIKQAEDIREAALEHADTLFTSLKRSIG